MAERLQLLMRQLKGSRIVPVVVLVLALLILGATVYIGALHLRLHLHEHMVNRDGEILHAVALSQQFTEQPAVDLGNRLRDPAQQLELALTISQMAEGVMAVRLFDEDGTFATAFPPHVTEATLAAQDLVMLKDLQPVSTFLPAAKLADFFWVPPSLSGATNDVPLLLVTIPLHTRGSAQLVASAQLILDGRGLAAEFGDLDAHLWWQALMVFLGGGILLAGALLWAFRRLQYSNRLLQERTAHLLRANHELTMAAKTTALGAVTAHLIHGLSNPLASLQGIVASHQSESSPQNDWQDVVNTTQRMQAIVEEVVRVLGEQNGSDHYEITLTELVEVLNAKVRELVAQAQVRLVSSVSTEGVLSNRDANLVLLILDNLVQNAVQVTPAGRTVSLEITGLNGEVICEVHDEGPGFPAHLQDKLFAPCRSTKGGSGIGLAICKQLADQLGARLEMKLSSPAGCVLELTLPRRIFEVAAEAETMSVPG